MKPDTTILAFALMLFCAPAHAEYRPLKDTCVMWEGGVCTDWVSPKEGNLDCQTYSLEKGNSDAPGLTCLNCPDPQKIRICKEKPKYQIGHSLKITCLPPPHEDFCYLDEVRK